MFVLLLNKLKTGEVKRKLKVLKFSRKKKLKFLKKNSIKKINKKDSLIKLEYLQVRFQIQKKNSYFIKRNFNPEMSATPWKEKSKTFLHGYGPMGFEMILTIT